MSVSILKQVTITDPFGGANTIMCDIAVGTNPTFYRFAVGGIPADTPDVQAYLNANEAQYLQEAVAAGAPTMTQKQVNQGVYAWQHWANRDVFAAALYVLETGVLTSDGTLANYRTILSNTLSELSSLTGTQFETHLNKERTAHALTAAPGTFTLAQCQAFETLISRWIIARKTETLWAQNVVGVLN